MPRILLAAAVVLLAHAAHAADHSCVPVKFKCGGAEPFWAFVLPGNGTIRFTDPENTNGGTPPLTIPVCAKPLSGGQTSITAGAPLGLTATVTHQTCTEPSGMTRPYTISISYTQGAAGGTPRQVSGPGCCRK